MHSCPWAPLRRQRVNTAAVAAATVVEGLAEAAEALEVVADTVDRREAAPEAPVAAEPAVARPEGAPEEVSVPALIQIIRRCMARPLSPE